MPRRKAGPKRKPGRPTLPEEDRLSVTVSGKLTTAEAIGLRWVVEARGTTESEFVRACVMAYVVPELKVLELRRLTAGKKKSDDE